MVNAPQSFFRRHHINMLFVIYFAASTIFYAPEEEQENLSNGWIRYWLSSFSWTPPEEHPVLVQLRQFYEPLEPSGGYGALFQYLDGHLMAPNGEDIGTLTIPELDNIMARVLNGEVDLARLGDHPNEGMESEGSPVPLSDFGDESLIWSPSDFRLNGMDDIFDVSTEAWSSGGEDDDGSGDERDVEE